MYRFINIYVCLLVKLTRKQFQLRHVIGRASLCLGWFSLPIVLKIVKTVRDKYVRICTRIFDYILLQTKTGKILTALTC